MLLFMVEQVFLLLGWFGQCIMQTHNAQCGPGKGRPTGREDFLLFKFLMSCHKNMTSISYSFLKVKPQLEEKTNETYEEFTAIEYKTQVVAGINYYIKVRLQHSLLH